MNYGVMGFACGDAPPISKQRIYEHDDGHILRKVRMCTDRASEVAIVAVQMQLLLGTLTVSRILHPFGMWEGGRPS